MGFTLDPLCLNWQRGQPQQPVLNTTDPHGSWPPSAEAVSPQGPSEGGPPPGTPVPDYFGGDWGGTILGGPCGGCTCVEDYLPSGKWWEKSNKLTDSIYYGEAAAYLTIAWKALVAVAEKKGYPKPIAPVCCKCGVLQRIQCMKSCIEAEEKSHEKMYAKSKWTLVGKTACGFQCHTCNHE